VSCVRVHQTAGRKAPRYSSSPANRVWSRRLAPDAPCDQRLTPRAYRRATSTWRLRPAPTALRPTP